MNCMKIAQIAFIAAAICYGTAWMLPTQAAPVDAKQQTINPDYLIPGEIRKFSIIYTGKVSQIPTGTKKLRVWIPAPQNTTVQQIESLEFQPPARLATDRTYGNQIAYWTIDNPGSSVEFTMSFVCTRKEIRMDLEKLRSDGRDPAGSFTVYKRPNRLVVIDQEIRELSERLTSGGSNTLEKVRPIYDHVLRSMTYDKNHVGWGLGSTRHACDAGKGNCTDFHALFNSLCRAAGIASGFEIGLYLPYERNKIEPLGGYHCWAFFRVPGKSWVPVDCSEADRIAPLKDYFFGNHTANRVTLSTGRDIVLEPKQKGLPLNYFLSPYAEADGKAVTTGKTWSYKDL
jgi:transglutaminase-like putative cysteine protease